jgi:lysophospholipase L1-like esterase
MSNKSGSQKQAIIQRGLLIGFGVIASLLLMEAGLRIAIALEVSYFRTPSRYAYPFSDDYWKLAYRWQWGAGTGSAEPNITLDPSLGWSPRKSAHDPFGLAGSQASIPDLTRPAVLFYGDSFVAGKTENPAESIPQQLSTQLGGFPVLNFGVSNYGVDQVYLRFQETHGQFEQPVVAFGVLTLDLYRSMTGVRNGVPKPRFTLGEDGRLRLHPVRGLDYDQSPRQALDRWFEAHPPAVRSYATRFLWHGAEKSVLGKEWLQTPTLREETQRLNAAILKAAVEEAQSHEVPIVFVIFYIRMELDEETWRERFLLETLDSLQVPYLDTKAVLVEAAAAGSGRLSDFYQADGNHLNALGNELVAQALADTLDHLAVLNTESSP